MSYQLHVINSAPNFSYLFKFNVMFYCFIILFIN